jgi:hypothetical protein
LLNDGRVLIAGGSILGLPFMKSTELYDPKTGAFTASGTMTYAHFEHTATLLKDGRVLIVGGLPTLTAAELFDPLTGKFSPAGSMSTDRSVFTASLLDDGNVLISGGTGSYGSVVAAELYKP